MLYLLEVSLTLCYISMSGGVWAKKPSSKKQNRFIVGCFCLAGLYRLFRGKWLTAQIWALDINNNHPLLDASLVDAVILHHAVSKNNKIK